MNVNLPVNYTAATPGLSAAPTRLDFGRIITMVRRRLAMVLALPVLFMALGFGVFSAIAPVYRASAFLLIEPKRVNAVGPEAEFAAIAVDQMKIASVVSVLESSVLLTRVVRAQGLADDMEFSRRHGGLRALAQDWLPSVFGAPLVVEDPLEVREARAVLRLDEATRVLRVGLNYVVRIDVTASTGAKAARLANAIGEAYLTDQLETKLEAVRRATNWYSERLVELRSNMIMAETAVERIRRDFNLTESDRGPGATLQRQTLSELTAQLTQLQADLGQRQSRLELAQRVQRSGNLEALPEVGASPVIAAIRGQQADVQRRYADAGQRFGPRHPDVLRLEEERRAVDRQLSAEVGRIVTQIRNEFDATQQQRRQLEEQVARLTQEGATVNTGGLVQLRETQRVAEAARLLYDSFLNRAREAEQQQGLQEAEARIITAATPPRLPSFPRLLWFLVVPLLGGLAVGVIATLVLGSMENWIVTASDVERELGLPALATVPLLLRSEQRQGGRFIEIIEYVATRPLSRFAEGLRAARVGIQLSNVDEMPKVIHFTSAVPGEGKSTLSAAFAISAAAAGMRVAVVDCDLRHPSISKLFGLINSGGVVDIVTGKATLDDCLIRYKDMTLDVVPTGAKVANAAELVGSKRFSDFVATLKERYDLVVLDSPPLLAMSDARVIAGLAMTSVVVVEWRATPREAVRQAIGLLISAQVRVAGVILNKVNLRRMRAYGYGYGYSYNYGKYYRAHNKYYKD